MCHGYAFIDGNGNCSSLSLLFLLGHVTIHMHAVFDPSDGCVPQLRSYSRTNISYNLPRMEREGKGY